MTLFTIGVYGLNEDSFFRKLIENNIDVFCDIRQRRGVRGKKYSFVNSTYLQNKLSELGIGYIYEKQFAPTREIRELQWAEDKLLHHNKKDRNSLGNAFCCGYELLLDSSNLDDFMTSLQELNAQNVVFFCVETLPQACHRSLLAKRLSKRYNLEVKNL